MRAALVFPKIVSKVALIVSGDGAENSKPAAAIMSGINLLEATERGILSRAQ